MGQLFSSPLANVPLHGPEQRTAAVDVNYCYPTPVTLRFQRHYFESRVVAAAADRVICEANEGQVFFRIDGNKLRKCRLLDTHGTPLLYMQKKRFSRESLHFFGDAEAKKLLFTVKFRLPTSLSKLVRVTFTDVETRAVKQLGMEIDLTGQKLILWLDESGGGANKGTSPKIPIAHINGLKDPGAGSNTTGSINNTRSTNHGEVLPPPPPGTFGESGVLVDIAPNIDIVLVTAIAFAIRERSNKRESNLD